MNELALFAGGGGGILGTQLVGCKVVCAVELHPYRREILMRRQEEGHLPPFPIWDDVTTFDGKAWRGKVDLITGGDPCQDASIAFSYGKHGKYGQPLGEHFLRIVDEVRPDYVLRENPARIRKKALWSSDRFAGRLERMGYSTTCMEIRACCLACDHQRARMFVLAVLADSVSDGYRSGSSNTEVGIRKQTSKLENSSFKIRVSRISEPELARTTDGMAHRVDRHATIGEGQVPRVAALAALLAMS